MSKLICYSLFDGGPTKERFEWLSYMRGFYFNARMNNLLFPDWRTHLEIDYFTYAACQELFDWLVSFNALSLHINEVSPPLCEGMLWRMKPLFTPDISHIICRDADSLTSYREAQCIQEWLECGYGAHAINDNSAHAGLMGGMVGFDCGMVKSAMGWNSWEQIIAGADLSQHGSDQHLLNYVMHPRVEKMLFMHNLAGAGCKAGRTVNQTKVTIVPQIDKSLWESNLIIRHIGTAGFNEMEALRFLKRFDAYNWKFQEIEKQFGNLFWWHL